VSGSGNR